MSEPNFANRTVWTGDNLDVLRGINSGCVDLIYLDPPFNSNRDYAAPIGSEAAGAAFKDTWTLDDVDEAWHDEIEERHPGLYATIGTAGMVHGDGMKSYLIMMAVRLLELKRVLKPTGSIYLHCDYKANSYVRVLLDSVFGYKNLRNEIVWCYTGPGSPNMRQFNRKHDTIYWYSVSDEWCFNADAVRIRHHDKTRDNFKPGLTGSGFVAETYDLAEAGKVPESWWAQQKGNGLAIAARQKKQYVGYPTQKPIALLERIIRASSNDGDVILDPFCGCATTLVAAETVGERVWAGIDLSELAVKLVERRLRDTHGLFGQIIDRTDIPRRTDLGDEVKIKEYKGTLYGQQQGHCKGCGVHFEYRNLQVDHIVPRVKEGTDHAGNLQLLCGSCNSTKGTGMQAELIARLRQQGILR
ncbi:DNA methyltransferase [Candidatus Palauibacter sp.]|uniref:DNA methyltransferase n=1 Tax=Candidatus Palauibacter sp. TaxID=3101350 RepID=UPI003B51AA3D